MEEKEKLPWKPPEIENLPDQLAYFLESYGDVVHRAYPILKPLIPNPPENGFGWKKEKPQTAVGMERQWERVLLRRKAMQSFDYDDLDIAEISQNMQRSMDMIRNQVIKSCAIPGESSTRAILRDLGEKEDENMEMSLNARKIKEVTIKCEDGKTYEGKVERIVGCPYDISSQELTVRISKRASGNYGIKEVIFQNPATIVFWTDGTKTVVNCMDNAEIKKKIVDGKEVTVRRARKCDTYSEEAGLAMAIVKKYFGNEGNYNNVFRKFIPRMAEYEKAVKKAAKKAKKTEE